MGDRVRVVHDDTGRLVAAKSPPPDDPRRGRREVAVLDGLDHPGVVRLVGLVEDHGVAEVRTHWVGSRSAADLPPPLPAARAAGLVLAVAATIGDLHRLGVVHRNLDPSHVLLDPYGRPVLCGFGEARRLGTHLDDVDDQPRPADDVAGLGHLLAGLLRSPEDDPAARGQARHRDDRRARGRRRALLRIAEQARTGDPACRPGLPAFVDAVRRAVPEATLGDPVDHDDPQGPGRPGYDRRLPPDGSLDPLARLLAEQRPERESWPRPGPEATAAGVVIDAPRADDPGRAGTGRAVLPTGLFPTDAEARRHRPPLAAIGAGLGVLALGAATFLGASTWLDAESSATGLGSAAEAQPSDEPATGLGADGAAPAADDAADPTSTETTDAPGIGPDAPEPSGHDPAGSTPATVVTHQGRRFAVGDPGDLVAVGDWHCTGRPVPAVYRPSTGALFVFWSWPEPGTPHATEPSTTVAGGHALRPGEPTAEGCATLTVDGPDGARSTFGPEAWR